MRNRSGWIAALVLAAAALQPGLSAAQSGLSNLSGPSSGMVPLGGIENDVLGSVSVGVPIAPGVSIDQKFSRDGVGTAISFPWVDLTMTATGQVKVNAVGPSAADLPNILSTALLNPMLAPLAANGISLGNPLTGGLKIGGSTNLGSAAIFEPR